MKKASYGKSNRLKSLFRWCLCLVVCCLLALSGTSLIIPKPVQATCNITPLPIEASEGKTYSALIVCTSTGTVGGTWGCRVVSYSRSVPNSPPITFTYNNSMMVLNNGQPLPIGSAGTYILYFMCQESKPDGSLYYPPQEKSVYLKVLPAGGTGGPGYTPIYIPVPTTPTPGCTVTIDANLKAGATEVFVGGKKWADMEGDETKSISSSYAGSVVKVDSEVQHPSQPGTRFIAEDNEKTLSQDKCSVHFDYYAEHRINLETSPGGIAQLQGSASGWYREDTKCNMTAPGSIEPSGKPGWKYNFDHWTSPYGGTNPNTDLSFNVSGPGTATAFYKELCCLTLKSDKPEIEKKFWVEKGHDGKWDLGIDSVRSPSFWGGLGAQLIPLNGEGTIENMNEPQVVEIKWKKDCLIPAIIMSLLAIAVIGLVYYFGFKRRQLAPALAVAPVEPKGRPGPEATTKAKTVAKSGFCPKCGAPVDKDAGFCNKCGKKLK